MIYKKIKYLALASIAASVLSACGGGTCAPNGVTPPVPPIGELALAINAPNQYPAGVAVTAYLTITNDSGVDGKDLTYSVPQPNSAGNTTGVPITINPKGVPGQDCTNIPSGKSCTFTAYIPYDTSANPPLISKPGSFTVYATPHNQTQMMNAMQGSLAKLGLQDGGVLQLTAYIGLSQTQQIGSNNFYIMPSSQILTGSIDKASEAYISVFVEHDMTTTANSFSLVDQKGKALTYKALGTESFTANSVNTYVVNVPAGTEMQYVTVGSLPSVCSFNDTTNTLSACSNIASIGKINNVGVLSVQPSFVIESATYNSQVITLANVGTNIVSNISLPDFGSAFTIDDSNHCSGKTLAVGGSCTFVLNYVSQAVSNSATYAYNYNNSKSNAFATAKVSYVGTTVTAVPDIIFSPDLATLMIPDESYPVTVSNIGNADAHQLWYDSFYEGTNFPVYIWNSNCGWDNQNGDGLLAKNSSCQFVLSYYGPQESMGSTNIPMTYTYGDDNTPDGSNDSYDGVATLQAIYAASNVTSPTYLSGVSPDDGSSNPEYYTTVKLFFNGAVSVDPSTVNGQTVNLFGNSSAIPLVAPIAYPTRYNSWGGRTSSVELAVTSETYTGITYTINVPNVSAIKDANGRPVVLDSSSFSTATPLSTFTAQGIVYTWSECNGSESCLQVLNPNNTVGQCVLLDNGGIVGCGDTSSVSGLTNTTISAASIYGSNYAHEDIPYSGNLDFIVANNNGTYGAINADLITPYTFTQFNSLGTTINNPSGISVISGGVGYVLSNGTVYKCGISIPTGLNSCQVVVMSGISSNAFGIYVDNSSDLTNQIMFITNKDSNSISECIANGSDFTGVTCQTITQGTDTDGNVFTFNKPYGVVSFFNNSTAPFNPGGADEKHYVYVTNSGYVGVGNLGGVTACEVDPSTGVLSNCGYYGYAGYSNPTTISVQITGMDRYLSIMNQNGSMTMCNAGAPAGSYWCNRYGYPVFNNNAVTIFQYIQPT